MAVNTDAVKHLERKQVSNANYIVGLLVEGGFLEETKMTEPERIAQAAREWLGRTNSKNSKQIFEYASGWSTNSWATVLGEKDDDHFCSNIPYIRNIFAALVILAKEADVAL